MDRQKLEKRYTKLINHINKNGARDIVEMAVDEYIPGFRGVVLYDGEEFHGYCWSHGTSSGSDLEIEVYEVNDQVADGEEDKDCLMGNILSSDYENSILIQLEYELRCNDDAMFFE